MDYDAFVDLYDRQYDLYREDLHFYARQAQQAGGRVLELGAGTGRVTVYLARRGVDVTGVELSGGMLQRAHERAASSQVQPRFVQGDMRDFDLHEQFELVIAPFNALMHLYTMQDQLAALQCVRRHMAPGGTFAFDLYVPVFGPEGVLRHEGETFLEGGARTDVFLRQDVDRARQLATTEYFVDTTDTDGTLRRAHRTLTQRYYTRFELEWLLRHAGFSARVAGSFEGGAFTSDSRYMVVSAQAKPG
ncbi:class I SAM-dependent methyltransferase [Deinococcus peraridilitoris]|uniref:Methylase involved in ubiquinone/menaquinone biosynthesis n=1 Tax=Deinococcus peraridilitoris (strain DSM 19664 / LMG 22246 / CIP 109416 / KR-200) TaxID=937777 RepID=L0A065_DEIPD|nr:class I SAM-dependent methyltransferase [Deinococcus peraridilitoris]AFZ67278.1 methylase involved in ubiquinone/menaquinone biosynthesis [Deinococcus peraridilitoris DSM 19664]